jgi:hypothetical protein
MDHDVNTNEAALVESGPEDCPARKGTGRQDVAVMTERGTRSRDRVRQGLLGKLASERPSI